VVDQLDRLLKNAESRAKSERAQEWVRHTRDCFDGVKTISRMFAAKRAFDLQPNRAMLLLVKDQVEAFEQWRMRILTYSTNRQYVDRWFPAYDAFCGCILGNGDKYETYYYRADIVQKEVAAIVKGEKSARGLGVGSFLGHNELFAPITWDFNRMMTNLDRPKEEKKALAKLRAKELTADGFVDPAEWPSAPALPFSRYQSPDTLVKEGTGTVARAIYDADTIYVRFECQEAADRKPEAEISRP